MNDILKGIIITILLGAAGSALWYFIQRQIEHKKNRPLIRREISRILNILERILWAIDDEMPNFDRPDRSDREEFAEFYGVLNPGNIAMDAILNGISNLNADGYIRIIAQMRQASIELDNFSNSQLTNRVISNSVFMSLSNVRSFVESFIRESEGTIGVVGLNNQMRVVILHTTVLNLLGNTSIHLRQIIDLYGNVRGEDSPWSGIVVSKRRQLMKSVVKRINNIKNMIARLCRRKG